MLDIFVPCVFGGLGHNFLGENLEEIGGLEGFSSTHLNARLMDVPTCLLRLWCSLLATGPHNMEDFSESCISVIILRTLTSPKAVVYVGSHCVNEWDIFIGFLLHIFNYLH